MHATGPWARRHILPILAVWLPVLALWSGLLWRLRQEWALSETYRFGFWVPLLVVLLLVRRDRDYHEPLRSLSYWPLVGIGIAVGLAIWPCEILIRANPDWRAAFWFYGLVAFGGSLVWLSASGGWRWAAWFTPALTLLFLAIPWLTIIEQPVIQTLSRLVAASAAEVANLSGIPATFEGNTIALANGIRLGVEDACSGLRSLQAAVMAAWFLGELVRLNWVKRLTLLLAGCVLAVVLNSVRAILLVTAAAGGTHGLQLETFHDRVGAGTALTLFIIIAMVTWILNRQESASRLTEPTASPGGTRSAWPSIALLGAYGTSMLVATLWFRQNGSPETLRVTVDWDRLQPSVELQDITPGARKMLRFSNAAHAVWEPDTGVRCDIFFLNWEAGRISSFADVHRPEICLPASGFDLTPTGQWSPPSSDISFETWSTDGGMHIFFSSWDCTTGSVEILRGNRALNRISNALRGKSIKARQSMEIVVFGTTDMAAARLIVQQLTAATVANVAYGPTTRTESQRSWD